MRVPRIPRLFSFKIMQIIDLFTVVCLRNSLICLELASPGFLNLKSIKIIMLHVYVIPLYLAPPAYLGLKLFK